MKTQKNDIIRTEGHVFQDGTAIELLRPDNKTPELVLLRWHNEQHEVGYQVTHSGTSYAPPMTTPSVLQAVRFPTRVGAPETTEALFADVRTLLGDRLRQLEPCITALVFAIFASWLTPALPTAPIISIFAPPGSPKNRLLQLLAMLCRHPLRLTGVTRGDLRRLPMSLRPTLLLDEPDSSPAMQSILFASSQRGCFIPATEGIAEFFGPKFVCWCKPSLGATLGEDGLHVSLIPVEGQLPPLDQTAEAEIAEQFQARFLGYFLRNFNHVQVPTFDVSALSLPAQVLAQSLAAAVVGDANLQSKILPVLQIYDEEIRSARAAALDSVVLEALLFFIHKAESTKIRMHEIAAQASAIRMGRGLPEEISAERVGWSIKRLGVPSGRLDRAGNGVELTESTSRLTHRLAASYGVRALQGRTHSHCRFCRGLNAIVGSAEASEEVVEDVEVSQENRSVAHGTS